VESTTSADSTKKTYMKKSKTSVFTFTIASNILITIKSLSGIIILPQESPKKSIASIYIKNILCNLEYIK